jgi:hypothetical protein
LALAPTPPALSFIAVLHAPQQDQSSWVATANPDGLLVRALAGELPPATAALNSGPLLAARRNRDRSALFPPMACSSSVRFPPDVDGGATLAISIEPIGGSASGQRTGPVVFIGAVKAL